MALTSLAVVADLPSAWQGDPDAQKALDVASSAIRDAADALIGPVQESTVTIRRSGCEALLRLPGPIVSVASVSLDGSALTGYVLDDEGLYRSCGWAGDELEVTYTHGLAEVPPDIVSMCTGLAVAWLLDRDGGMGATPGVKSVKIDDGAESYTDEAAGQVSPVFIPDVTRQWLRARFSRTVEVVGTR